MADVNVKYKGNVIAEMSESGTKTLKTSGKYCEGDFSVIYEKPSNGSVDEVTCKSYKLTIAKSSSWVKLLTLDPDILAHINDATFKVMLAIDDPYAYEFYSGNTYVAFNTPYAYINDLPVYGYNHRQASETLNQYASMFYPANNTDATCSLGGYGMFRLAGSDYYVMAGDGFIRGGNYTIVFTW